MMLGKWFVALLVCLISVSSSRNSSADYNRGTITIAVKLSAIRNQRLKEEKAAIFMKNSHYITFISFNI